MSLSYHYNTQNLPPGSDWQADFPSEIRARQFYQSRKALWEGIPESLRHKKGWQELEIERHLHLKGSPEILVSLSHTKGVGGAVSGPAGHDQLSIGIDLEWEDRQVKMGMEKFYLNDEDDRGNYTELELWSLKEAAFKSISPLLQNWPYKRFVLKHIWIKEESFGLIGTHKEIGSLQLHKEKVSEKSLLISLASLKQIPNS